MVPGPRLRSAGERLELDPTVQRVGRIVSAGANDRFPRPETFGEGATVNGRVLLQTRLDVLSTSQRQPVV